MNIYSFDTLKAERRQGTHQADVPFLLDGKKEMVTKKIVNGEMETFDLAKPIGEMLTTDATRKELIQKVVLDVELGREEVPLLYQSLYETITDPNLPKEFEAKWAQNGTVVFFEHLEGEEVKFGSLEAESGPIARIRGYAAGFEYTKEMQIFNQTFNFTMLNKAFGEAHNALLNHLHFGPILGFKYKQANKTDIHYVDSTGTQLSNQTNAHYLLSLRETIRAGIQDARRAKRPGNVLLVHSMHQQNIEEALQSMSVQNTPYAALAGITDIIYYDGWSTNIGRKSYDYAGVSEDKAYLIRPKRGFKELIKQGLQINSTTGDLSRLVESQIIGDFWRGVFAAVEENVQEITLPIQ